MKRWTARLLACPRALTPGRLRKHPPPPAAPARLPGHCLLTEGLPSGDRILIAYFSAPETDGVDTVSGGQPGGGGRNGAGQQPVPGPAAQGETGGDLFYIFFCLLRRSFDSDGSITNVIMRVWPYR